jgi:outer membrane receptor for ferrienterochelin and colicin
MRHGGDLDAVGSACALGVGGARWLLRPAYGAFLMMGLVAHGGCAGATSGGATSPPRPGTLITQEKIAASGAKTAWDAIRLTVPNVQLRESRGKAARIRRRGRASIYLDDQVRVVVDNARLHDLQVLQEMPAADILAIEVLSGLDGTTYYGTGSTSGVIVIRTKAGAP